MTALPPVAVAIVAALLRATADPQDPARIPLEEIAGVTLAAPRPSRSLDDAPALRARYDKAGDLAREGNIAQAIAELDEAINSAQGDYFEPLRLMAELKFRAGRIGDARTTAEYAALIRPGDVEVHYLLGRIYQSDRQLEPATAHFKTATLAAEREMNNPRVTAAWFELGQCLAARGFWTAAAESYAAFDRALWETSPEHRVAPDVAAILTTRPVGAIELQIEAWNRVGRVEDAARAAAWAVQTRPDDPTLGRIYVGALLGAGRPAEALRFCRDCLKRAQRGEAARASEDSPFLSLALDAARAADQIDAWIAEVRDDVLAGSGYEYAAALARRLDRLGDSKAALPLWEALVHQQPGASEPVWALAAALRAVGDVDRACQLLVDFVAVNPESALPARQQIAGWTRGAGATQAVLELIRAQTEAAPTGAGDERAFARSFVLAMFAHAADQPDLAERLFRRCLEQKPDFALGHIAHGHALLDRYRWEDARAQAQAAIKLNPRRAEAFFLLARAADGLDDDDAAADAFKTAIKLRPDEPAYAVELARHLRRVGNNLAAQRYFQQALSADPRNPDALEGAIESYVGDRKLEIALEQTAQAEKLDVPPDALRRIQTLVRFAREPFNDEHLAELRRQTEQHPRDVQTALRLAAGLYLRQAHDEATRALTQVLAFEPDNDQAAALLATIHYRALRYDEALALLQGLAARFPNRTPVLGLLADTLLADFRVAECREALRRLLASKLSEDETAALRQKLFDTYDAFSEFDAGLALVEEWRRESPENEAMPALRVALLTLAGRQREALEEAEAQVVAAGGPAFTLDRLMRARALYVRTARDTGQEKVAVDKLRQWLADSPNDPQLTHALVDLLIDDQRPEEALAVLKAYRPAQPTEIFDVIRQRAAAHAAAGRVDDAEHDLLDLLSEPFIQNSPQERAQIRLVLTRIYRAARQFERGIATCDAWLARTPPGDRLQRLEILALKRQLLQAADRMPEFIAACEEMRAVVPADPGVNNDLGYTLADRGEQLDRATGMIRLAVAADPLNPMFLDSLGWACYRAGQFTDAQKYLERAVRLREGQDPVIYDHLGDAEYRLGDVESARRRWTHAQDLIAQEKDPNIPGRTALVASLRTKLTALERSGPAPVADVVPPDKR